MLFFQVKLIVFRQRRNMDLNEIKDKAMNLLKSNEDKVDEGIDKAAELADKALPETMDDKIEGVKDAAKNFVDKVASEDSK